MSTAPNDLAARRHAALVLWLANLAGGICIGTSYLAHLPEHASPRAFVFAGLGLVSSVATLALLPALVGWLSLRFLRRPWAQGLVQAASGALFLVLLEVDTIVFRLLGYHLNSAVWNVLFTRGSEDAVILGAEVWAPIGLVIAALIGAELFLWRLSYRRALAREARERPLLLRPAVMCVAVLFAIATVEKSIYASAEREGDRELHGISQMLPMYTGLRVSQLLPERADAQESALPRLELRPKGEPLAYPRAFPAVDPDGPRPNILLLVLDSWRRDMLSPLETPELWRASARGRRFDEHWSGGNGTRFGVFSMLYGLHGSYWFSVLAERRPPVMLEVLAGLGYERVVFSSASQSFPEFRDTAWVGMEGEVHDDHAGQLSYERDRQLAEAFDAWLEERRERSAEEPFFAFLLLDAPHQPYFSPAGGPFQPAAEELNYLELARSNEPALVERVFNRYRNAVHEADRVAGAILSALERSGELENTLVVITGDHGEEFQETGFWGHTSNFTRWQLQVPFVLIGPGIEAGVETRPTSHLDLPATLLELLGADPGARSRWTQGESLLAPSAERLLPVAGWDHVGLCAPDALFRVKLGSKSPLDLEVFDERWRPHPDSAGALQRHALPLERLERECRAFLARP